MLDTIPNRTMPPSLRFSRDQAKLIPTVKLKWILRAKPLMRHRYRKVEPHCHHILKLLPSAQQKWAFQSSVGNGVNSQTTSKSSRDRLIEFGFRTVQEKSSIPDAVQKLTGRFVQLFDLKEGASVLMPSRSQKSFLFDTLRTKNCLQPYSAIIFSAAKSTVPSCRVSESIGIIQGPGELVKNLHELIEGCTFQCSRPEKDFPIIANIFATCM